MSATIGAPASRVWGALTDPSERALWDDRILGTASLSKPLSSASERRGVASRSGRLPRNGGRSKTDRESPYQGEQNHWRFRMGSMPVVLHEEIVQVDLPLRLASHVSIGSLRFDQTLTFHAENDPGADDDSTQSTRLGMKLVARNRLAIVGDVVSRLDVQKLVMEYVDATLRQVQKHCESGG